jgi:hypothetical protein
MAVSRGSAGNGGTFRFGGATRFPLKRSLFLHYDAGISIYFIVASNNALRKKAAFLREMQLFSLEEDYAATGTSGGAAAGKRFCGR